MDETDIEGYLNTLGDEEEGNAVDAAGYLAQMYGVSLNNPEYNNDGSHSPQSPPEGWNNPQVFRSSSSVEPAMLSMNAMSPSNPTGMINSTDPYLVPNISISGEASETSSIHHNSGMNSPYLSPTVSNSHMLPTFDTGGATSFTELENFENLNINQPILEWPDLTEQESQGLEQDPTRLATVVPPEINVNYVTEETPSPATSIATSVSDLEFEQMFPKQEESLLSPISGVVRNRQRSLSDSALKRQQNRPPVPPTNTLTTTWNGTLLSGSIHSSAQDVSVSQSFLSPNAEVPRRSRSTSHRPSSTAPSRSRSRSRSSNRDYILELAAPTQPHKRVQKHPSAFACHMCDKKFTRAYNLRSHLRTHTDERPFICTVCGKAFARQHDRKRHEALHSGEKKFECSGVLGDGVSRWGCGRKFARADALGRHFRTAAGKLCIKPLLDEELLEDAKANGQVFVSGDGDTPSLMLSPPPSNDSGSIHRLPNALLQQFPSLVGFGGDFSGSEFDDDEE
jgi:hypothetical protein